MKTVTIRRCPVCSSIRSHTDSVVAALKSDPNLRVNVVDGAKGEFTVEADGQRIGKTGDSLPDVQDIVSKVGSGEKVGAL